MSLIVLQNSQENTCAGGAFLMKLQEVPAFFLKKKLQHRCFSVSFANFLRTPFYKTPLFFIPLFVNCSTLTFFGSRSSYCKYSIKRGAFNSFAKFTGEHLCRRRFFNEVAGGACIFLKKETPAQMFFCEFCKFFKNTF